MRFQRKKRAGGWRRYKTNNVKFKRKKHEALLGKTFEVLSAENRAAKTSGSGIQRRTA